MSNGMIMCASTDDKEKIELIRPPEGSKIGERIQYAGNPIAGQPLLQEKEPVLNPKKKYMERFLPQLKTSDTCEATYNGVTMTTSAGPVKAASLKNANIS